MIISNSELERRRKISETTKGRIPKNFKEMQLKGIEHQKQNHGNSGSFKKGHKYTGDNFKAAQQYNKKNGTWLKGKHHTQETKDKIGKKHYIHGKNTYAKRGFKQYEYICNRCGITNKLVLLVHHKDRNRYNNEIENLEILCWNCHIIEHNKFRGKRK